MCVFFVALNSSFSFFATSRRRTVSSFVAFFFFSKTTRSRSGSLTSSPASRSFAFVLLFLRFLSVDGSTTTFFLSPTLLFLLARLDSSSSSAFARSLPFARVEESGCCFSLCLSSSFSGDFFAARRCRSSGFAGDESLDFVTRLSPSLSLLSLLSLLSDAASFCSHRSFALAVVVPLLPVSAMVSIPPRVSLPPPPKYMRMSAAYIMRGFENC